MPIYKAQFGNIKFDQIEGYKISVAFTPNRGFEGNFYVYIWDYVDADKPFDDGLKVADGNERLRDVLTISQGSKVTYEFPDIDLSYAEIGATRALRYRIVEFRYNQDRTDRGNNAKISIKNETTKKISAGALKDDYDFKLDDGSPESLLGFRARLSPYESTIVRFSSIRNNSNSLLEKIIETNESQINDDMKSFKVSFKQHEFDVNVDNLQLAFVDESYGLATEVPLPVVNDIINASTQAAGMARLKTSDFLPRELLDHDMKQVRHRDLSMDTVETTTLFFKGANYKDIQIV
jgi:hypothetical protein